MIYELYILSPISFVSEQPGITITANIGYQNSAGLHVTALNPAYAKSTEPDHLYEKLPEDLARERKETYPGHKGNTEQHSVGVTNDMRSEDDDKELPNDDLVLEDAKVQSTSENTQVKECKENDHDYYANDEKNSAKSSDYYVNDDLVSETTKGKFSDQTRGKVMKKGNDQKLLGRW